MESCKNCMYFEEGICRIPLWVDGSYYEGTQVDNEEEHSCCLFAEEEDGK